MKTLGAVVFVFLAIVAAVCVWLLYGDASAPHGGPFDEDDGPRTVTTSPSDTAESIAARYADVSVHELMQWNRLEVPTDKPLGEGRTIYLEDPDTSGND